MSAQEHFDALAADHLRRPGVSLGRALHAEGLKAHGKLFAFVSGERLVVKVPAARAAQLVDSGQAVPFESGGRRMREWVAAALPSPPPDGPPELWRTLMDEAAAYVAGLATRT